MHDDFKFVLDDIENCEEEICREYARKATKLLAAYTMAVDDLCSASLVGKIIKRFEDLTGAMR
jgi:hypothetical protein